MTVLSRPTILIVDDTPDNITLLSNLLKDKYNTKIANNGGTALQILASGAKVDLILLDVMMPDIDGYETCRRIKSDPSTSGIPVIFLTAKALPEDEALGRKLGAADYLSKPVNPVTLFSRVSQHISAK
jgi:CheY-like chemotaxis protein